MNHNSIFIQKYNIIIIILFLISSFSIGFFYPKLTQSNLETNTTATTNIPADIPRSEFISNPVVSIPFSGFVQNSGQLTNNQIKYYYSSNGLSVAFLPSQILLTKINELNQTNSLYLSFVGSLAVNPVGLSSTTAIANYFINGMAITNVHHYQEIVYTNLYPHIDLRYYFSNQGLKYEFIVKPGGNPANIHIQSNLDFSISTKGTKISYFDPTNINNPLLSDDNLFVYQKDSSNNINAYYSNIIGKPNVYQINIDPSSYNHAENLVIDPIWVEFSTYFGGAGTDVARAVATDTAGNTYIVGYTNSPETSFPLKNAFDSTFSTGGGNDAFVAKLNATGNGLIYSTYIGGSGDDKAYSITVDSSGNAYVTGFTSSSGSTFPLKNAYNSTNGGSYDAFVLKLNSTGNGLDFSTFIGGTGSDQAYGLTLDTNGNIYVTGTTNSNGTFPLKNAFQNYTKGSTDGFILKLNSTGNGLIFSTFFGGDQADFSAAIAVDSQFNVYVTGNTASNETTFPLANSFDNTFGGGFGDAFVLKLNATGNGLVYSTYLGGSDIDEGWAIHVDNSGNALVAGDTASTNFPALNGYDTTHNGVTGVYNAFITKINSTGTGLIFSTFFGGTSSTDAYGLGLDSNGNIFITGPTQSTESSFPLLHASDTTFNGGIFDLYIAKFNSTGNGLLYSSFIGGSSDEYVYGLAVDNKDNPVITGYTKSTDFETVNAFDSSPNYTPKAFISKFSNSTDDSSPVITLNNPTNTTYYGKSVTLNYAVSENNPSTLKIYTDGVANTSSLPSGSLITFLTNGSHTISLTATDKAYNSASIQISFTLNDALTLTILSTPSYVNTQNVLFSYSLVNKTPYTSSVLVDGVTNASITNNSIIYLSDGPHNITLSATDSGGNVFSQSWLVTVDSMVPVINVNSPSNNYYYSSGVTFDYSVSDLNLLNTTVIIDGNSNTTNRQPGYVFSGLSDSLHNLTIVAIDKANNTAMIQIFFTIDTTFPVITIDSPNISGYNTTAVYLNYTITESNIAQTTIYTDNVANNSIQVSGMLIPNLVEGTHNITILVVDKAGNFMSVTKIFTIDTTSPTITIISPVSSNSMIYDTSTVALNYTISDQHGFTVQIFIDNTVNTTAIPSGSTLVFGNGNHTIEIISTDSYGNKAIKTVNFEVEQQNTSSGTTSTSSTPTTSTSALSESTSSKTTGTTSADFSIISIISAVLVISYLRRGNKKL